MRIDGGTPITVNLYRPATQGQQLAFAANNLTLGQHTLQITALGQKNGASSGYRVAVDAFTVLS